MLLKQDICIFLGVNILCENLSPFLHLVYLHTAACCLTVNGHHVNSDGLLCFVEQVSFFKFAKFQIEYLSLSVFVGSASRRCMLDNNGVAFWGPPSFARCVSLEYRYLHLSVSSLLTDVYRTLKLFQHENKSVYSSIFHHLSLLVAVSPASMTPLHQTCLTA